MPPTTLKSKVIHFMLWRLGESVDWDCSAKEMADEVGCSERLVGRCARKSGWKLRDDRGIDRGWSNRRPVDEIMEQRGGRHE